MSGSVPSSPRRPTPVAAVLALTVVASFSTGVFWNGMPFVAEKDYQFTEFDNFLLFFVVGLIYVAAALGAGSLLRLLERRARPRSVLGAIIVLQGAVCALAVVDAWWIVWVVTMAISALSAFFWPVVEGYLAAGKAGARLRFAIGLWNVAWTIAVAISLILMTPFMREGSDARWAIVVLGGVNLLGLITLFWFNPRPMAHGDESAGAEIGPEYGDLLHSARILLPVSYILVAMISPLMPYRMNAIDVDPTWRTTFTATWMLARVAVIMLMWQLPFWHGRWGALLFAGAAMTLGFLGLILAPNAPVMFFGLALFGAGQGVTYYAALYYVMSVGRQSVDAGGTHEGLIGVGYAAGPLLGLASIFAVEWFTFANPEAALATTRIVLILIVMLVSGVLALRPYRAAVRRRVGL